MTSPDRQARELRTAIERQRLAQDTAREIAAEIARERDTKAADLSDSEGES